MSSLFEKFGSAHNELLLRLDDLSNDPIADTAALKLATKKYKETLEGILASAGPFHMIVAKLPGTVGMITTEDEDPAVLLGGSSSGGAPSNSPKCPNCGHILHVTLSK